MLDILGALVAQALPQQRVLVQKPVRQSAAFAGGADVKTPEKTYTVRLPSRDTFSAEETYRLSFAGVVRERMLVLNPAVAAVNNDLPGGAAFACSVARLTASSLSSNT
jgi:hypothetical protein